ncbi:NTR domain-containing protein-like [Mytilus edulis]|uniref:NTR domain-containing protein-like n=1 Tax=Mytilus edulis TaxID=6550 RepID=UPI0039EE7B88
MKPTIVTMICLVLLCVLSEARGRRCKKCPQYDTNQKKLCRATFATKGIIKSQRRVDDKIEYTVKPNYNFIIKLPSIVKILSPTSECGVFLSTGYEYLISGVKSRYGNTYETHNCFWNDQWIDIPANTQTELTNGKMYARCNS